MHGGSIKTKPFQELKEMLITREYTPGIVNSAIAKAKAIFDISQTLKQLKSTSQFLCCIVYPLPALPRFSAATHRKISTLKSGDRVKSQ